MINSNCPPDDLYDKIDQANSLADQILGKCVSSFSNNWHPTDYILAYKNLLERLINSSYIPVDKKIQIYQNLISCFEDRIKELKK